MKRAFDVGVSLIAALLLSPIILMTAVLIRIKLGSPILFKQPRVGYNCKEFTIYKFRTMTNAKDKNGIDLPDSERLTSLGKVMRKLSLDEFPQLWNVIKGDMSLVGPRPLLVKYLPYYTEEENTRHHVRPGITGLAQVSGRNNLDWDSRLELDVRYVQERCMLLDLKILFQTFTKVLRSEGVVEIQRDVMLDLDDARKRTSNQRVMYK
jgi:lipopolysaccharide/colanic/teichoic acid biosynthesis glycosyltransferase